MTQERVQRRLAAILAADVVGFSSLMEQDEVGTLTVLKKRRKEVLEPLVSRHAGRIFKIAGDGVLVEFASAVNALQCAIDLQREMAAANSTAQATPQIVLRVGVNLGDVIVEGSDLYGDGINIAARLESLAEAGGILVSSGAHDQVRRKLNVEFDDLGPQKVKGIRDEVHIYRVRLRSLKTSVGADRKPLPLPVKPSIAVLPFSTMGGDIEQESFVDGLSEDLITDLSQAPGIFVIARNSSFAYKGKSVDARAIGRELGVKYLVEGSARRAAGRIRINVQFIDAQTGGHLWAERFDRNIDDVFAVQDEVTARIVEALVGRVPSASPQRSRPASIEAYDLCVRARQLIAQSPQAAQEARMLLERSIAMDSSYAEPVCLLALNLWFGWAHWGEPAERNRPLSVSMARKAAALDPNYAGARWILGLILTFERCWKEAEEEYAAALQLDANHADAWAMSSNLAVFDGRCSEGVDRVQKALRLNPHPPPWYYWLLGQAQYGAGQYAAAAKTLQRDETYRTESRRILAASLAQLGRMDEAQWEAKMFAMSNPHFTVDHWVNSQPYRDHAVIQHFAEGYLKAGLPD